LRSVVAYPASRQKAPALSESGLSFDRQHAELGAFFIQFLLESHPIGLQTKQFSCPRLGPASSHNKEMKRNKIMNSRITDNSEGIDRRTSRSICDAVGERLQQDLRPESLRPSSHLQHLMDELRRRDRDDWRGMPN
jgi:hypothetical protein